MNLGLGGDNDEEQFKKIFDDADFDHSGEIDVEELKRPRRRHLERATIHDGLPTVSLHVDYRKKGLDAIRYSPGRHCKISNE